MAELFQWLSQNPIATNLVLFGFALVIIVFVLAVAIATAAIMKGRSISIGGLAFGPTSESRSLLQTGAVNIPANHPSKSEFFDGKYDGRRTILVPVTFNPPFKRKPDIVVSLQKIDLGDFERPMINRLLVSAQNPGLNGFDLCFETWADSKVYDAAASWIAVGE